MLIADQDDTHVLTHSNQLVSLRSLQADIIWQKRLDGRIYQSEHINLDPSEGREILIGLQGEDTED